MTMYNPLGLPQFGSTSVTYGQKRDIPQYFSHQADMEWALMLYGQILTAKGHSCVLIPSARHGKYGLLL